MEEREAGLTLIDCLERWRDEYGAAVAVRDKTTSLTYAELFDESSRFASGLASEGVEAGDKIVLQLPNKAESLVVLFGSVMRGCIPVLALPTHRETEIPVSYTHLACSKVENASEISPLGKTPTRSSQLTTSDPFHSNAWQSSHTCGV